MTRAARAQAASDRFASDSAQEDAFDMVELTPWVPPTPASGPLREIAFNSRAWLPEDDRRLREMFAADVALSVLAWTFDRTESAVRERLRVLGLRRRSALPWNELEDAELARRYGAEPAADIALDLGRTVQAVYVRAQTLGLGEPNPPRWTPWEDAQLREAYARDLPLPQISRLIGRPMSGVVSRASTIGLRRPSTPEGWTDAEDVRLLELAHEGLTYPNIATTMAAEGFPRRTKLGIKPRLTKLGYGRGWGRNWTPEEDDRLRQAYARGENLRTVGAEFDRGPCSIRWRVEHLGLQGSHPRPNGWRQGPDWTEADSDVLRAEFGKTPTRDLAQRLNRGLKAVLQRANAMGLVHGMHKPWTDDHARAVAIAWRVGLGLTDLSIALGRQVAPISKYAQRMGLSFSDPDRPTRAPRGRRMDRPAPTLAEILALATDTEREVRAVPLKARGRADPNWKRKDVA
jgi:hypothetical protein